MTRLLVATGDSIALLREDAHGWSVVSALEGSGAQCIAVGAEALYAGCRDNGLWRSADGGRSWEDCGLPERDVFSVAVSAADGAVYAGCEPSALFRSRDDGRSWEELGALKRIPSAPTWSFPPRPWTSHVRWIAPSPHEADRLLVGIELGGVMLSEDGGESFADHRPGAVADCHALAWHPREAGRAYEAGGRGAAWSFDAGHTFQPADEGRDRHYVWGLAVEPADPDRWYVSASPGPFQAHGRGSAEARIYRWSGSWEPLADGLPDPLDWLPYALAVADGRLLAGLGNGELWACPSGGGPWECEGLSEPLARIVALAPLGG